MGTKLKGNYTNDSPQLCIIYIAKFPTSPAKVAKLTVNRLPKIQEIRKGRISKAFFFKGDASR